MGRTKSLDILDLLSLNFMTDIFINSYLIYNSYLLNVRNMLIRTMTHTRFWFKSFIDSKKLLIFFKRSQFDVEIR